jgi:hypothetical protein
MFVVSRQGHRWYPGEFLGEDHAIDQSAVRSLAKVRAMAWAASPSKNQAAGEPAPTVDLADGIDQQIVERRHPLHQVRRGG